MNKPRRVNHPMYDQLKAASDLGVPVVGVGLLYQQVVNDNYSLT